MDKAGNADGENDTGSQAPPRQHYLMGTQYSTVGLTLPLETQGASSEFNLFKTSLMTGLFKMLHLEKAFFQIPVISLVNCIFRIL